MMSFNDFVHKYKFKNKATSDIKNQQVLPPLSLNNVGICLRDGPFSSDVGVVKLHPLRTTNAYQQKGTHWVANINENYFDSYGCVCPNKNYLGSL